MASPQRTIDLRPELPPQVQAWGPQEWAGYYRNVNYRLSVFAMLYAARGAEDSLTQDAWESLVRFTAGQRTS